MTKAELLADIEAKADGVVLATELVETVGAVNRYVTNVFTTGEDSDGGPIAQKRNVSWYVYDEGGAGEAAYYGDRHWQNPEARNIHGSDLDEIEAVFRNAELRTRVTGVICKGIRSKANRAAVSAAWAGGSGGVLDVFMAWVASNATIQANGGTATDSDLEYVVLTEAWDNVTAALT
jgi:hypothetical protein